MAVTIVQTAWGSGAAGATFANPPSIGNVILASVQTRGGGPDPITLPGSASPDTTFTVLASIGNDPERIGNWVAAKVATTTQQNFRSWAFGASKSDRVVVYELSNADILSFDLITVPHDTTHLRSFDGGDFVAAPTGSMAFGFITYYPDGPDPGITDPVGWSLDYDLNHFGVHYWTGHIAGADVDIPTAFSIPANGYNEKATNAIFILLQDGTPVPSEIDFVGDPLTGTSPLTVEFTDLSDPVPSEWAWTFGDGGTSTEQNPTHVYTKPGVYDVTLTVNGETSLTKSEYITVRGIPVLPYFRDRLLLSVRASYSDEDLYNHAIVVATGNKAQIIYAEVKDEDPESPTNISDIGNRVFVLETDQITTQQTANKAALKAFLDHCLISENISIDAICNPALEGNDVVGVQETTFSMIERNFRLQSFSIPLSTSRQTLHLARVINLETQTVSVNDDIVLVGVETAENTTADTSVSVDLPAGVEDGDFLLIWAALDETNSSTSISVTGGGWNSISGSSKWKWTFANSEPSSYTVSWSGSRRGVVTILAYRNVDTSSPVAKLVAVSGPEDTSVSIPAMSLASGEYHLIAAAQADRGDVTYTWPAAWTEQAEAGTSGSTASHVAVGVADKPFVGSNPKTFNVTANKSTGQTRYQIALRKDIS